MAGWLASLRSFGFYAGHVRISVPGLPLIAELDVFTAIRVDTASELDGNGRLPVTVSFTKRPRWVVGFGADFNASEGFGARVYWGHRNLFGRAKSLWLEAEVGRIGKKELGDIDYRLGVLYRAPDFLARLRLRPTSHDRRFGKPGSDHRCRCRCRCRCQIVDYDYDNG